jgi:putative FmdB family regulatory protein
MPLYDFQCEQCEHVFEVERSMTETRTETCPKCGSKKTVKVFSSAGIQFKGSGFYVTDSKPASNGASLPSTPSSSDSDTSSDN